MKRTRKLLALALALMLMLSGVTALAGETKEAWLEGRSFDEHMTFTVASIQIQPNDYNVGDEWVKWWTDTFNVEWDISSLTWENWATNLRTWINADDMPDWCIWNYVHGEAVDYADQELVRRLPDDWKEKYPNLAAAAADCSLNELVAQELGGYYYLFRPVYSNNRPCEKLSTHISAYLRQDWADQLNIELKDAMTISEIMAYAKACVEAGLAKYGVSSASNVMGNFIQWNSTYSGVSGTPFYLGEDGTYKWGAADECTLEALKILNTAYKEGVLHPEFYTLTDPDDVALFYSTGEAAVTLGNGMSATMDRYDLFMEEYLGLDYHEVAKVVAVLGEDGYFHSSVVSNYWAVNIFSPYMSDEKFDRLMQVMDYSCTQDAQYKVRMGIQGVDWEMLEDGSLVSLTTDLIAGAGTQKYAIHPIYGNMMILSDDFQFLNPTFSQSARDKVRELYILRESLSTDETLPANPDLNVLFHSSTALNLASMTYYTEYLNLVVSDGDVEANWKAWIDEKMPMIQPVLDELNAGLAAQ